MKKNKPEQWENWGKRELKDIMNITNKKDPIKYILKYLKKGKILEAGCGPGKYVFNLADKGYNIAGIDFNKKVIQENEKK